MQRLLISFLSLVAFAPAVHAQAAPDAQPPAAPASNLPTDEPPVASPPGPTDAPPPPAEIAPPPAAKPPEDMPRKLAVAKDSPGAFFTPGLLLQSQFVWDETTKLGAAGASDVNVSTTTFKIRRLEISAGGEIIPRFVKYKLMFDPSRVRDTLTTVNAVDATGAAVTVKTPVSALSTLQDFYITFQGDFADVSFGQFKNPVSWDGFNSAAKILLPERAFVANLVGGQRDLGVRIEKTFTHVMYTATLQNGAGQNNFDNNNQKDASLRLEVYPVPGMTIAGVTYDSIGYRTKAGTKDRWEGDFRYETGPFLIQSEFIRNSDVFKDGAAAVSSQGAYVALAYMLKDLGSGNWKGNLQPVLRFGFYDPDTDSDVNPRKVAASNFGGNDERIDYEVGLNYYLRNHEMKLQASYDRQEFDQSKAKVPINEVIFETQVWF
jgi:Phosphate-selective porin O and P